MTVSDVTLKRCVLRAVLKVSKLQADRIADSSRNMLFQVAGADTAKECWLKSEES